MVTLLHIVDSQSEVETVTRQLNVVAEDSLRKYNYKPEVLVVKGDIFVTIKAVAEKLDSPFIFMGTHGIQGMQKITGSWAHKIIGGASCPFIVVQKPPQDNHLENIVFPIMFKKGDNQKVSWVIYLNQFYKFKLTVYVQKSENDTLKAQIYSNLVHTKTVLDKYKIEYTVVTGKGTKDFADEVSEYANSINADAIIVGTEKKYDMTEYIFSAGEERVIANKYGISVITVHTNKGVLKGFN